MDNGFIGWKINKGVKKFDLPLSLQRRGVDQTFPVCRQEGRAESATA